MKKLISEKKRIEKSKFELQRRRMNWRLVTQNKIENNFQNICNAAIEYSYPFRMFCKTYDKTENEATVQLSSRANKTGVIERIEGPDSKTIKAEAEKGAALVASFASNGTVAFIIYPYKSERYSRNEENIMLYHNLSPDDITEELIERCLRKYLLYVRNSSVFGGYSLSLLDLFQLNLIILADIRNRRNLYRSALGFIAEWSKILVAGIIGYIVATLTNG